MKVCPFCCKEDLVDEATKCPHCAAWLDGLTEGEHVVEIKSPGEGYREFSQTVVVKVNERTTVQATLRLAPDLGSLRVIASVPGAIISLDGEDIGVAPARCPVHQWGVNRSRATERKQRLSSVRFDPFGWLARRIPTSIASGLKPDSAASNSARPPANPSSRPWKSFSSVWQKPSGSVFSIAGRLRPRGPGADTGADGEIA